MNNCTIILFGATGDLACRKIIPALYHMIHKQHITRWALVASSIDSIDPKELLERSKKYIPIIDLATWQTMLEHTYFVSLDVTKREDYHTLKEAVERVEQKTGLPGNRIFYLATAAYFFCDITHSLAATGLARRSGTNDSAWHRIIYEKPFGHDLDSARMINECIESYFSEDQIFRIDHFLTKELVGNIGLIRFSNSVFEPLWNNNHIDNVQIILSESIGIEGRGAYYDSYGALSDVVQNHCLEMLALIAMEAPEKLVGDYIRESRAAVLSRVRFNDGILGQYNGYEHERGVKQGSRTETFAALAFKIDNERWQGVPFYVKTGKALQGKETVIHIEFKPARCILAKACPNEPNVLTIEIAPDAGFRLKLNAKKVGSPDEVTPVSMEFCHSCLYGPFTPEDYEVLFQEVIRGDQSVGVRFDEIEFAWNIIDQIKQKRLPLYSYQKGSNGPEEIETFEQQHAMRWRS